MNMLSGAKYLKDGHPVMVDKDGVYRNFKKNSSNICTRFWHITHRGEILYSRGRISTCKTVYIEFLCFVLLSVPVE